ncbi:neurabin-1 isoform X8 [Macrosteles quadrilineatus]|uniref:neurabin-1 isoform X8 n=1 Tax=Macrosteles quadrilineatus TaxID=74068 RepID=UPI0023E32392|nr:neurabin-1 isoform X8 [Macrosteles quadrilineatus]
MCLRIICCTSFGRGVDDKRRREEDVSDGLVEGENNDLKRHKVELSASVAELLEAERHHTTTVMAASPSEPSYKFSSEANEGVYHFQPATVTPASLALDRLEQQLSPPESEEDLLLKKLDDIQLSKETLAPRFNLSDPNSNINNNNNNMCSSSVSEEDSGFLSSETPITKELDGLTDSVAGLSDSCAGLLDSRLLDGGLLDVPDVQYADEDSSEEDQYKPKQQTDPAPVIETMTPDEADNLLSSRILEKRSRSHEALLSDEEAQEVVRLLSPDKDKQTEPEWLQDVLSASMDNRLASSTRQEDSLLGSTATIDSSVADASSHLGSQSDLLSVNSLDDLDISRDNEDEDDPYHGFVPEPNREVYEEKGIHYYEDGHFWMEMPGLQEAEDEPNIPVKQNTKVTFSQGPIKVYSTFSMSEYDRRNDDVDPVAASAEYELEKRVEKLELLEVELLKGPEGLGLSIIGMGVGADAGLEKLGIFVKTITENGAAAKDGRIQVNDQIIEVDGKSLVGVTQAYAASVLRNTCGPVKFVIGREKDPHNSEVAQLIRQSLQADREREEHRRQMERQRNQLLDQENNQLASTNEHDNDQRTNEDISLEGLKLLLQESRLRTAVADAEVATLKARVEELEETGASREETMERLRQASLRVREVERSLASARKDVSTYQDMLEQSQGQYIVLEKKYYKAKRLLREFLQRETDLLHREEFYIQLLQEKDTEYNALVKALKDRIIQVEAELVETQRVAGLPVGLPGGPAVAPRLSTPPATRRPSAPPPPLLQQLGAELSETEDSADEQDRTATVERKVPAKEEFDKAVPQHELLDSSAHKSKAELAMRGGLANRQAPTGKRSGGLSNSSSDYGLDESNDGSDDEDRRRAFAQQYGDQVWHSGQLAGPPPSLAEQLKQVLAERERRAQHGEMNTSTTSTSSAPTSLEEEFSMAVNQANAKIKKGLIPGTLQYPWQQSSPSSSGSVSPGVLTADPSPSKLGSTDSSDVWSPPQPSDLNSSTSSERKSSTHIWHSAPVSDWSKEQVCQWLMVLGLEQHIPRFLEHQVTGTSLLALESRDLKSLGLLGDDKTRLKRKLKELRVQVEKERRQHDKERKEKERLLKKAEKLAEKASRRK